MDADRSNSITFEEFSRGVAMVGLRPLPADGVMRCLFASFDRDGNGRVSWEEMLATLRQEDRRVSEAVKQARSLQGRAKGGARGGAKKGAKKGAKGGTRAASAGRPALAAELAQELQRMAAVREQAAAEGVPPGDVDAVLHGTQQLVATVKAGLNAQQGANATARPDARG